MLEYKLKAVGADRNMAKDLSSKLINLFKFIKEINIEKINLNFFEATDIPFFTLLTDDELVKYNSNYVKTCFSDEADYYFSIQLPELLPVPVLPKSLRAYVLPFDAYTEPKLIPDLDLAQERYVAIQDMLNGFIQKEYKPWQEKQIILLQTRKYFYALYEGLYKVLQQSDGMYDLFLGGVWLNGNSAQGNVKYPLLMQPVNIEFDTKNSRLKISRGFRGVQRNDKLLMKLGLADPNYVNDKLSLDMFSENIIDEFSRAIHSQPNGSRAFSIQNRFVLFLKNKNLNLSAAIDLIVEDLKKKDDDSIPQAIKQFVKPNISGVATDNSDDDVNKAAGYDIDALLAKPANEAQIKLVKALAHVSHILVQGPPGTGKTHTIANMIGHLLTQGKSILVSSYTSKALRVLREKLPTNLQDYCVSVLPDSNPEELISKTVNRVTEDHASITSEGVQPLQREIEQQQKQRQELLEKASGIRAQIYKAVLQEKQSNAISIGGESVSLSKAADFLSKNKNLADNIPGEIATGPNGFVLPLTTEELVELYATNHSITAAEEDLLSQGLPQPSQLLTPEELKKIKEDRDNFQTKKQEIIQHIQAAINEMFVISATERWTLKNQSFQGKDIINFCEQIKNTSSQRNNRPVSDIRQQLLHALIDSLNFLYIKQKWEQEALYDYLCGNEDTWQNLADEMQEFIDIFNSSRTLLVTRPNIECNLTAEQQKLLPKLRTTLQKKGKVGWFHRSLLHVQQAIKLNGQHPQTAEDITAVQITLQLRQILSNQISILWKNLNIPMDELINSPFQNLPVVFSSMVNNIHELKNARKRLLAIFLFINQSGDLTIHENLWKSVSSKEVFWKLLLFTFEYQKNILELDITEDALLKIQQQLFPVLRVLKQKQYHNIRLCENLWSAMQDCDITSYAVYWKELNDLLNKQPILMKRRAYLAKLSGMAPQWASQIKDRVDLHGKATIAFDPQTSWKFKIYESLIKQARDISITELQDNLQLIERHIRLITGQLIENLTKLSIANKISREPQLLSVLRTLLASFKLLGKGKGKRAPQIKKKILSLTNEAKDAIPVWVMPLGAALEQFTPTTTCFDVLILDEASQLDLKALVLIYMAKQVIIVGDDAQITPSSIGATIGNLNALCQKYNLPEYFPAMYHLFGPEYSVYDFAQQSNFMPIMLKEHFRCVPEIIGFSNSLSYGNQIKPLRDASNVKRKPAMVSYQVPFGKEEHDINLSEAQQIVALIYGCLQQPEYEDATFGVISLRKEAQTKRVMNLLLEHLGAQCCEKHRILCGLSRDFQGDERDVMFLSMVDSPDESGLPLRLQTADGKNDMWKKIYNVAVSRAKDQLWVIHSLTKDKDLQPTDIRRTLLDWIDSAFVLQNAKLKKQADSVFEEEVGRALTDRGYKLDAQVQVGAYRIDLVASYQGQQVAIECDGEAYHSSAEQIQQDMHRQAVLERCGWRFERLRGSHYYGDKHGAIEYLIKRLNKCGIYPEATQKTQNFDVLERIKIAAQYFMQEHFLPKEEETELQTNTLLEEEK